MRSLTTVLLLVSLLPGPVLAQRGEAFPSAASPMAEGFSATRLARIDDGVSRYLPEFAKPTVLTYSAIEK